MVTDQEPRYRFRDANGNITGTVFERGGELVVQEGTSGNENELVLQSDGTVQAERLAGGYLYAGAFPGSDADARLDNALQAAVAGTTIYLEPADYQADRTISAEHRIVGTAPAFDPGTNIPSGTEWTITQESVIEYLVLRGDIIVQDGVTRLNQITGSGASVTVQSDECICIGLRSVNVTFKSGTSGGIVDASTGVNVTDNGSNTVGDIA